LRADISARAGALPGKQVAAPLPEPPDEEPVALPGPPGGLTRKIFWVALLALACVGALAAAGTFRTASKPASLYQRTMAIAGEYRCPVCAGESAASSDAPAAVEIRHLIGKWLAQGMSPAQIRANLVADYGSSILEKPPASGLDVLVWVLPVLAAASGAAGLAFAFARWRKRPAGLPAPGAVAGSEGPTQVPFQGALFDPGPISQRGQRLEPEVVASTGQLQPPALEAADAGLDVRRPPLWRRLSLPAGIALVALAVALLLVDHFSAPELPGGTITGGITGLNSELEQAQALMAKDPAGALAVYQQILKTYPDQPIALSAEGWIYAEAGFEPAALSLLDKAERADPSYGLAHLYRGLALLDDRRPKAAATELEWYLGHDPAPAYVQAARRALAQASHS
jgi:cytochrome c-type biogenesis protein CcmH